MRFFDDNHQWWWSFKSLISKCAIHSFDIHFVDAPGKVVCHQNIGLQRIAIAPKFQDNCFPLFQKTDDFSSTVLLPSILDEIKPRQSFQPAAERGNTGFGDAGVFSHFIKILFFRVQQQFYPVRSPVAAQSIRRANHLVAQAKGYFQHFQIFGVNVRPAHGHHKIRLNISAAGVVFIQRKDCHPVGE